VKQLIKDGLLGMLFAILGVGFVIASVYISELVKKYLGVC